MCDLCGSGDDLVKARTKCRGIAGELSQLAQLYFAFAAGSLKPHTDEAKTCERQAIRLIRSLAEEWL